MKRLYAQGDVIVKEMEGLIPEEAVVVKPKKGFNVLAEGEISGHVHCLTEETTKLFEHDGQMYLRCLDEVKLKHMKLDGSAAADAHDTITLPKKDYKIDIKREFDWFLKESRQVSD